MKTQFLTAALVLAAASLGASAQTPPAPKIVVDTVLAEQGKAISEAKMCMSCHTIGQGELAGPDLLGVTERRDTTWLMRFLDDPPAMAETDSIVRIMAEKYPIPMAKLDLTEAERRALIHYLARESARVPVKQ